MNILLCGATGFIGRQILAALQQAGHEVLSAAPLRPGRDASHVAVDFTRDTTAAHWLSRLQGVDAVVNAVGVLRDTRGRPMQAIHQDTPCALFEACAQVGVRRVIQVSALGIAGNATRYAQTKRTADERLLALNAQGLLDGVVLRPSIVFGRGGDSSQLFMALARSPVLALPRPVIQARVQPVAVRDLAQAVARLLDQDMVRCGVLPCVGPTPLALAEFIASLRQQRNHGMARVATLPDWVTLASVKLGDHLPWAPWCSETLALLAQDNVADPTAFAQVLGHPATPPDRLVSTSWH